MIKKIIFACAIVIAFSSCNNNVNKEEEITTDLINNPATAMTGSENLEEDNLPFFEFVEKVKEFGKITQGESVTTDFRFRNVGKSNLIISSAQGSCGCTVPEWPKEPIEPGEDGVIKVTFNSEGKQGMQNKTVTLVANTIPNTIVIALKGEVLIPETK